MYRFPELMTPRDLLAMMYCSLLLPMQCPKDATSLDCQVMKTMMMTVNGRIEEINRDIEHNILKEPINFNCMSVTVCIKHTILIIIF